MSTRLPEDADVRDRLLTDLDTSFVAEAAAGTGKTTVLVGRIVAVVKTGRAALQQIIAVTFTDRAAGEMKLRLRDALERARSGASAVEDKWLRQALEELEVARISTIHGLCADILKENPTEAGVDPLFELLEQRDANSMRAAVFRAWFERVIESPGEGVRRVLRRVPKTSSDETGRQALQRAAGTLIEHRDFNAPWRRPPFEREAALDELLPRLEQLGQLAPFAKRGEAFFVGFLKEVQRFVADIRHREAVSPRDYDGIEADLRAFLGIWKHRDNWSKPPPKFVTFEGKTPEQVNAIRQSTYDAADAFLRGADADLAACLHEELRPVVELYEAEKAKSGKLDFVDLLLRTRNLLRSSDTVRRSLQKRNTHLFVDEFQDTDPLQGEIILLLAADDANTSEPFETRPVPGKLFLVGDPKQAVYRFRRADIVFYNQVKTHLLRVGAELAHLSTSFRSTPGIQAAVNGSFESAMTGGRQPDYVPLGRWRPSLPEQPSVIALSVARPFGARGKVTKTAMEASVPHTVAAFIDHLINASGWQVREDDKLVPVAARHVCILFKRFINYGKDVPRAYARALEARQVPHVLVGGRSFHSREEVIALRTALWAIERPEDEFSVYATLKGPFFGFSDGDLLAFRETEKRLHPLKRVTDETRPSEMSAVLDALSLLRELHIRRNHQPVATTAMELLERTRAFAGVAFWRAGDQALANLLQVAEQCVRLDRAASSFRAVLEALEDEAQEDDSSDAPLVEEGTEGVRMMTAHRAKGLEFPIVILAEPTANVVPQTPSHWVDARAGLWAQAIAGCVPTELREQETEAKALDQEESIRLTYVAATRACDVLVVPVAADDKPGGTWTSVLYPSLYPSAGAEEKAALAPGCPAFGDDTVLERVGPRPGYAPRPGLHRAATGKNGVVWWDPKTLQLDVDDRGGLERGEALVEGDKEGEDSSQTRWEEWRTEREKLLAEGSKPSVTVRVAKDFVAPIRPGEVLIDESLPRAPGRPGGRRFGALVHSILAQVPLDAEEEAIAQFSRLEARALLATPEEEVGATKAVQTALGHRLMRQAASLLPDVVRREVAVTLMLKDGSYFEGTADLAFDGGTEWVVVEFKTDEELERHRASYEAQTEAYVDSIRAATGRPARGIILRV